MALVDYASSEEDDAPEIDKRPSKRSKTGTEDLPSLPASFLDLYSSTVRTSNHDDPALHGGRKRIIPHVEGNWPTHAFLEWHPSEEEFAELAKLVQAEAKNEKHEVHSLLRNELGVSLPLHVSLSRPLVLKTQQKDDFLARLKRAIERSTLHSFDLQTTAVRWHPNEDQSRYFLVVQLSIPAKDELRQLLTICNEMAMQFDQPLLYAENKLDDASGIDSSEQNEFHISVAWSLGLSSDLKTQRKRSELDLIAKESHRMLDIPPISIRFQDVKVRIGQEVHAIQLQQRSKAKKNLFQ